MRFQVGDIVRINKDHQCDATRNGYATAHDKFGNGRVTSIGSNIVVVRWATTATNENWTPNVLRLVRRPQ